MEEKNWSEQIKETLLSQRKIFMEGRIDAQLACDFLKNILFFNQKDPNQEIDVFLNSMEAERNAALLIHDVIQGSRAPVRLYGIGRISGAAVLIFASGKHGRYMLPNSELILSEPFSENTMTETDFSVKRISDCLLKAKEKMTEMLSAYTGRSEEEVEMAMYLQRCFSTDESLEFGLCDQKISFEQIM